jgi:hypothetical protein
MKQENNMKRKMNQVNPKAGTLKQNMINWSSIQNASKKLIASVMMLAIITMNPGIIRAGIRNEDTCCSAETTGVVKMVKSVKLSLPSTEMVRKADSEANSNMIRSLFENKLNRYRSQFIISDAAINRLFAKETSVSLPSASLKISDEKMNNLFNAENILMTSSISGSDSNINDIFQAENQGIRIDIAAGTADEKMNLNFFAENINLPGHEIVDRADAEISRNLVQDNGVKYAKNSSK